MVTRTFFLFPSRPVHPSISTREFVCNVCGSSAVFSFFLSANFGHHRIEMTLHLTHTRQTVSSSSFYTTPSWLRHVYTLYYTHLICWRWFVCVCERRKKFRGREREKMWNTRCVVIHAVPSIFIFIAPWTEREREREKEQDGTDSLAGNDKQKKGNERLADPSLNVDYLYNYQTR